MPRLLSALIGVMLWAPAYALTSNAPPASGFAARAIVMGVDSHDDLCTGTALARDLVLTAAHCVAGKLDYQVKTFQTGQIIAVRAIALHPRFDLASYAASRATADLALLTLSVPRIATLPVTGKPGSLQIRLYDLATRNQRIGLGACTGDSGAPVFEPATEAVIGVVSWSTAPGDQEGCGGLTGVTPLLLYREWIVDTARKFNSPVAP